MNINGGSHFIYVILKLYLQLLRNLCLFPLVEITMFIRHLLPKAVLQVLYVYTGSVLLLQCSFYPQNARCFITSNSSIHVFFARIIKRPHNLPTTTTFLLRKKPRLRRSIQHWKTVVEASWPEGFGISGLFMSHKHRATKKTQSSLQKARPVTNIRRHTSGHSNLILNVNTLWIQSILNT